MDAIDIAEILTDMMSSHNLEDVSWEWLGTNVVTLTCDDGKKFTITVKEQRQ